MRITNFCLVSGERFFWIILKKPFWKCQFSHRKYLKIQIRDMKSHLWNFLFKTVYSIFGSNSPIRSKSTKLMDNTISSILVLATYLCDSLSKVFFFSYFISMKYHGKQYFYEAKPCQKMSIFLLLQSCKKFNPLTTKFSGKKSP